MKLNLIIILLIVTFFLIKFNRSAAQQNIPFDISPLCDSIPELNKKIIEFVNSNMHKKVGRGECWDVAAGALNYARTKWDGEYQFGQIVNYKTDCVYPGDIIQFKGVKIHYRIGNRVYDENMDQHTAIIFEVIAKGTYILAHQNTSFSGRKIGLSPLDIKDVSKGKFIIYRPVK